MIKLENLTKSYHDGKKTLLILDQINLELAQPSAYCLLGKSGAGKSTLLHLLAGIESVSAGKITVSNQEISSYNEDQLAIFRQDNIGLIFQMHNLLPEFTARENVMMPALIKGMDVQQAEKQADEILNEVGLEDRSSHRPSELSGGEQQRVAIARALITKPPVILADEPTGSLDAETSTAIEDLLLEQVIKRQIYLICATHNRDFAGKFRKVYKLEGAKITEKENTGI